MEQTSGLVFDLLSRLSEFGKISAIGQSAVLYQARDTWDEISGLEFETVTERDEHFENQIFAHNGYQPETVRRYCLAWEFLDEHHAAMGRRWENFLNREITDLIALGQNCKEHGPLDRDGLTEIDAAPDNATLRKTLRRLRGQEETASKVLSLVLQANGTLEVWQGDEVAALGYVNMAEGEKDLLDRGRARLIRRAGINLATGE